MLEHTRLASQATLAVHPDPQSGIVSYELWFRTSQGLPQRAHRHQPSVDIRVAGLLTQDLIYVDNRRRHCYFQTGVLDPKAHEDVGTTVPFSVHLFGDQGLAGTLNSSAVLISVREQADRRAQRAAGC